MKIIISLRSFLKWFLDLLMHEGDAHQDQPPDDKP